MIRIVNKEAKKRLKTKDAIKYKQKKEERELAFGR